MSKDFNKIKIKDSTDDRILEVAKDKSICDESATLRWITVERGHPTDPSPETDAVVVDLITNPGAIRVYEKSTDTLVDGVYMDDAGFKVIVPWNSTWCFRVSGSLLIAYIERNKSS